MQNRLRRSARAIFAGAVLSWCATAEPAAAECGGAKAVDACMTGAWKQTGGGEMEWMIRNLPSALRLQGAARNQQIMVLNGDGGYWTAAMEGSGPIRLQGSGAAIHSAAGAKLRSRGQWSAAQGKLRLCSKSGGSPQDAPAAFEYTCSGDSLETRHTMPGMSEPITTQYERIPVGRAGQ